MEDRLLAAIRRDHLGIRIDLDAEPALAPAGNSFPQLGQTLGERIARQRLDAVDERLPDQRIRLLARIALAEVDQLHAGGGQAPLRFLQPDERVRAGGREHGGELHG